jgi:hypothetical protein
LSHFPLLQKECYFDKLSSTLNRLPEFLEFHFPINFFVVQNYFLQLCYSVQKNINSLRTDNDFKMLIKFILVEHRLLNAREIFSFFFLLCIFYVNLCGIVKRFALLSIVGWCLVVVLFGHDVRDVVPWMSVESLLQALLIHVMTDETDAAAQHEQ